MIINTLGAIIATLVVLSRYPVAWRWTRGALIVIILLFMLGINGYVRYLSGQIRFAAFSTQYHSPKVESLIVRPFIFLVGRELWHVSNGSANPTTMRRAQTNGRYLQEFSSWRRWR